MIGDIFVFDNVIHVLDMSDENTLDDVASQRGRQLMMAQTAALRGGLFADTKYDKRFGLEEMHKLVFEDSPTDMAMAQVVPIFEWYEDFFAPVAAQYEMAAKYPDQVLFCGGVDPLYRGLPYALEQIDVQIRELGACSMKFYNGHETASWRCDDREIAYPLYERCRQLGVQTLQFHKGVPFGLQPLDPLSPLDLQAPARDFPDLNFIIHHLAMPYFDEVVSIAARFPNVYLSLSGNLNAAVFQPRPVQQQLGRLLLEVGVEKLLWGSEAALAGGPAPYLEAFMDLQIPEDLSEGWAYPQLTWADRERILGRNFAELMGIDIDARRRQLQGGAAT